MASYPSDFFLNTLRYPFLNRLIGPFNGKRIELFNQADLRPKINDNSHFLSTYSSQPTRITETVGVSSSINSPKKFKEKEFFYPGANSENFVDVPVKKSNISGSSIKKSSSAEEIKAMLRSELPNSIDFLGPSIATESENKESQKFQDTVTPCQLNTYIFTYRKDYHMTEEKYQDIPSALMKNLPNSIDVPVVININVCNVHCPESTVERMLKSDEPTIMHTVTKIENHSNFRKVNPNNCSGSRSNSEDSSDINQEKTIKEKIHHTSTCASSKSSYLSIVSHMNKHSNNNIEVLKNEIVNDLVDKLPTLRKAIKFTCKSSKQHLTEKLYQNDHRKSEAELISMKNEFGIKSNLTYKLALPDKYSRLSCKNITKLSENIMPQNEEERRNTSHENYERFPSILLSNIRRQFLTAEELETLNGLIDESSDESSEHTCESAEDLLDRTLFQSEKECSEEDKRSGDGNKYCPINDVSTSNKGSQTICTRAYAFSGFGTRAFQNEMDCSSKAQNTKSKIVLMDGGLRWKSHSADELSTLTKEAHDKTSTFDGNAAYKLSSNLYESTCSDDSRSHPTIYFPHHQTQNNIFIKDDCGQTYFNINAKFSVDDPQSKSVVSIEERFSDIDNNGHLYHNDLSTVNNFQHFHVDKDNFNGNELDKFILHLNEMLGLICIELETKELETSVIFNRELEDYMQYFESTHKSVKKIRKKMGDARYRRFILRSLESEIIEMLEN